ncbi:MAG: hypothetical protein ABS949_06760 [Solibacillus sp.]
MQIALITSIVAACSMTLALKGLHLFHFITWKPVGFFKKWGIEGIAPLEKWFILLIICFVVALIFYSIFILFPVRADIISFLLGVLIAVLIEWLIFRYPFEAHSFKELSIPFIVVMIIITRFIIETAVFARNNLVR